MAIYQLTNATDLTSKYGDLLEGFLSGFIPLNLVVNYTYCFDSKYDLSLKLYFNLIETLTHSYNFTDQIELAFSLADLML